MKEPEISVIVPVYNVEKYLEECIGSISAQSLPAMEIICVNDGSTDHSLKILKGLKKKDSRIKIINKENSGYGDTLNTGIKNADGKYIGIVESDDIAVQGMFEKLYCTAQKYDADVVKGNYYLYFSENNENKFLENLSELPYEELLSGKNEERLFFNAPSVWSGIYKRSFLQESGIAFQNTPGASYQDVSFDFKIWMCAQKAILIKDPVLHYRQDNEASSVNSSDKVFCICNEMEEIKRFIIERNKLEYLPIFARNKYIKYRWNLNRLKNDKKKKFLMRMRYEFRVDFYEGSLVKKYWNNQDWEDVHRLLFDFKSYMRIVLSENIDYSSESQDAEATLTLLRDSSPLAVYGAGKRGIRLAEVFKRQHIKIDTFIVTEKKENPDSIMGIPIIELKEASALYKDILIIIGVASGIEELSANLKAHNLNNYILINKDVLLWIEDKCKGNEETQF